MPIYSEINTFFSTNNYCNKNKSCSFDKNILSAKHSVAGVTLKLFENFNIPDIDNSLKKKFNFVGFF